MKIKVGDSRLFFDVEGAKLRPDGPRMKEVPTLLFFTVALASITPPSNL
jgi:hypothetical protein